MWGGGTGESKPPPPMEAQNYRISLLKCLFRIWCLVEGCLGGSLNKTNLQVHFVHRHARYTIVILEEGN